MYIDYDDLVHVSNKFQMRRNYERAAYAMQVSKNSKHAHTNQSLSIYLFMPSLELFQIAFAFAGGRCCQCRRIVV